MVPRLEEQFRGARTENRLGSNVHDHHLVAVAVEQLPFAYPDRFRASFRRDLRFTFLRLRKWTDIDFGLPRLIGSIG